MIHARGRCVHADVRIPQRCRCWFWFPNEMEQAHARWSHEPTARVLGVSFGRRDHRVRSVQVVAFLPFFAMLENFSLPALELDAWLRNLFERHDVAGGAWLSNTAATNYLTVKDDSRLFCSHSLKRRCRLLQPRDVWQRAQ